MEAREELRTEHEVRDRLQRKFFHVQAAAVAGRSTRCSTPGRRDTSTSRRTLFSEASRAT
jgi:hypothetical protein